MNAPDSIPPVCSAADAERWLLSAAMNGHPDAVAGLDFYGPLHQELAGIISTMHERGAVELVTVQSALKKLDHAESLRNLTNDVFALALPPTREVIEQCRAEVTEAAAIRKAWQTTKDITAKIESGGFNLIRHDLPGVFRFHVQKLEEATGTGDFSELDACRVDVDNMPPKPVPIFTLNGNTIITAGNLAQLQSQAKAGKTAVMGAMIAAALAPDEIGNDTFGFSSATEREGAIIVFDCEQSNYKAHAVTKTALARAGLESQPQRLRVYSLVEMTVHERRKMLAMEMERAAMDCGSIHSVFLDGVADLCVDPNDTAEAFALVQELHALAYRFQTVIVGILHENPGTMTAKSRGHLGSQLERKAEANLILSKDENGITEIYGPRCRECSIPKGKGPRFKYDDATGMHISCEPAENQKKRVGKEGMKAVVEEVFENVTVLRHSELIHAIMRIRKVKDGAADNYRAKLMEDGLIRQNEQNFYTKAA